MIKEYFILIMLLYKVIETEKKILRHRELVTGSFEDLEDVYQIAIISMTAPTLIKYV